MKKHVLAIIIFALLSTPVYCEESYAPGKIIIEFKLTAAEEEAVSFVSRFGLEIIKKVNFDILRLSFIIGKGVDDFVREARREPIVASVSEGEDLAMEGREGKVVRIRFKEGTDRKRIDALRLKYSAGQEVIAWRYERIGAPYILLSVPVGKERDWVEAVRGAKDEDLVEAVTLVSFDVPE